VALLALLLVGLGYLTACGGGGSGGNNPPPPSTHDTPAGTYHLTVTATSGTMSVTQQLTLVVQ
jgi:hypothetical protein